MCTRRALFSVCLAASISNAGANELMRHSNHRKTRGLTDALSSTFSVQSLGTHASHRNQSDRLHTGPPAASPAMHPHVVARLAFDKLRPRYCCVGANFGVP
jgi:hypothetical protein